MTDIPEMPEKIFAAGQEKPWISQYGDWHECEVVGSDETGYIRIDKYEELDEQKNPRYTNREWEILLDAERSLTKIAKAKVAALELELKNERNKWRVPPWAAKIKRQLRKKVKVPPEVGNYHVSHDND